MHILHLEDDGPLREILKVALEAVAPVMQLKQFTDSDSALAYVEAHKLDLDVFILDIRVPGSMDGLGVARQIRAMGCPGSIVITSAYRQPDPKLLQELNCRWFPKPWHIMELMENLKTLKRVQQ